jgi:hypothetical protein
MLQRYHVTEATRQRSTGGCGMHVAAPDNDQLPGSDSSLSSVRPRAMLNGIGILRPSKQRRPSGLGPTDHPLDPNPTAALFNPRLCHRDSNRNALSSLVKFSSDHGTMPMCVTDTFLRQDMRMHPNNASTVRTQWQYIAMHSSIV